MRRETADLERTHPRGVEARALKARLLRVGLPCERPHCRALADHLTNGVALCETHYGDTQMDLRVERQKARVEAMRRRH